MRISHEQFNPAKNFAVVLLDLNTLQIFGIIVALIVSRHLKPTIFRVLKNRSRPRRIDVQRWCVTRGVDTHVGRSGPIVEHQNAGGGLGIE